MKKCAALLTAIVLTGCAKDRVVVTAVNTLCISTTRYHATQNQVDAMKQDELLWGSLVEWLAGFNKVRDKECLAPPATSH